ncbi:helix-turn-helix domain-containing protein [Nakamurella sp.]|uniref:arsenate reductase/protein-tyrosine-phosphatase family protein n=1 Tax=Nakamurella sp. TaxID=1869182 RepID=UPI0037842580
MELEVIGVGEPLMRRARVHAALGEPARLAIVDRLVPGDASPGELGQEMGIATNLLAHHLRVLEDAGLINRVRSEGDRRRSYVRLRREDPLVRAAVGPAATDLVGGRRVVFVCTHNSARSQLAAASWTRLTRLPVACAGTHPADRVHPGAVAAGRRRGLRLGHARTAHVDQILRPADLVVTVCDNAHEELEPGRPRLHWSIPDPVRVGSDEAFDAACDEIIRRITTLAGGPRLAGVDGVR